MNVGDHDSGYFFSKDYATAQGRFRQNAVKAGGRIETLQLNARGPAGEQLGIDIASFGPIQPRRVLVHSSGLHGVEGFAGSAIQLQALESGITLPNDTGVVFVHILNPYGMIWLRRVNENNVDLNRNFPGDGQRWASAPDAYRKLNLFLNPETPPSPELFTLRIAALILRYGLPALKRAVHSGQYEYPKGLFFGGKQLEQGPREFLRFLTGALSNAKRMISIDVHTGLGKYGEDSLLCSPEENKELRRQFGERVESEDPDEETGVRIRGLMGSAIAQAFRNSRTTTLIQEFGTYGPIKVFRALRAENRWHHYGGGSPDHVSKRELKEAFCPSDESWRRAVLTRGQALFLQALDVLQQ